MLPRTFSSGISFNLPYKQTLQNGYTSSSTDTVIQNAEIAHCQRRPLTRLMDLGAQENRQTPNRLESITAVWLWGRT